MPKKEVEIPRICPFCGASGTVSSDGKHFGCSSCGKAWPVDYDPKADLAKE